LQLLIVQVTKIFADYAVIDVRKLDQRAIGRIQVGMELLQIARVIPKSMRRNVALGIQIAEKFLDRLFHLPLLRGVILRSEATKNPSSLPAAAAFTAYPIP
jgi:hypothetical protein